MVIYLSIYAQTRLSVQYKTTLSIAGLNPV